MSLELPPAFVERMQTQLGADYPAFEAALQAQPHTSLRFNPRKPGSDFEKATPIPWNEQAVFLPERPKFFLDPLIYTGSYYVQEASSMLIGQCLDFSQDLKVLDLCAAPGGKSTLLASQLSPGSLLVSNELVYNRSRALIDNLSRWGNPNVVVTNNHPRDFQAINHFFDAMVVDAPCSGEGMFRKDPKVIGTWTPGVVRNCALRQKDILRQVIGALKVGGLLVYSTCTYNPSENEAIVQWLLDHEQGGFEIVPLEFPETWGLTPGTTQGFSPAMRHSYHCYPHKFRGEGFFIACLRKTQASRSVVLSPRAQRRQKSKRGRGKPQADQPKVVLTKKDAALASEYIQLEGKQLHERYGGFDAVPEEHLESVQHLEAHLKILKAGIRVGTVKKGKFIPDHDLALSEQAADLVPLIEVDQPTALKYMKRESLRLEVGEVRDWAILTYQGRHLGWVKVLDDRVNNHLPKELRLRAEIL